jgi:hypothetical protein
MTEENHLRYHLEVSLTGCGVPGCEWTDGLALHFRALKEIPVAQPSEKQKDWLPEDEDSDLDL